MHIQQDSRSFRRTSLALFAGGFSTFAILYCLQPLLPQFSEEFEIAPATASLALSVTTMAVTMLFVGALSDAAGRKPVMTLALFGASILAVIAAVSSGFKMLIIVRVFQGIVLAGLPAIAMTYLGEEMEPASLGYAMGLYISGNSIGGMGGRIITGILTHFFNWRIAVAVVGVLSIAAAFLFWVLLPQSRNFQRQPLRLSRVADPLISQFRDLRLICLYGLGFLLMGGFVTLYNYIGYQLLAPPYGLNQALVSWIFIVYITGTISSTWMGRLSDRHGRGKVMGLAGARHHICGSRDDLIHRAVV